MKTTPLIVLIVLILTVSLFLYPACNIQKEQQQPEQDSQGSPAITISTNKQEYEYGEPIEITVSRGDYPAEDEPYLEVEGCGCEINRVQALRPDSRGSGIGQHVLQFEGHKYLGVSDECASYSEPFAFNLGKLETRKLVWDQKSCETKEYLFPAVPDDYEVSVDCTVADFRGSSWEGIIYRGIGDSVKFKINEPLSCKDKRIEIVEAKYNSSNNVYLKIKNIGILDVEAVQVAMEICEKDPTTGHKIMGESTDIILDGIKAGETKEYIVIPKDKCYYDEISVHVYECYDENSETWATKELIQPQ